MTRKQLEKQINEHIGEAIHSAFRKGTNTSTKSWQIWGLIRDLPEDEWAGVCEFVAWGLAESINIGKREVKPKEQG